MTQPGSANCCSGACTSSATSVPSSTRVLGAGDWAMTCPALPLSEHLSPASRRVPQAWSRDMLRTSGTEMRGGEAVVGGGGSLGEIVGDGGGLGETLGDGGGLGEMVGDVTTRVAWTPRLPPPQRPVIEYVPGRTPDRIVAFVLNLPLPSAVVSTSWF